MILALYIFMSCILMPLYAYEAYMLLQPVSSEDRFYKALDKSKANYGEENGIKYTKAGIVMTTIVLTFVCTLYHVLVILTIHSAFITFVGLAMLAFTFSTFIVSMRVAETLEYKRPNFYVLFFSLETFYIISAFVYILSSH